MPVKSGGCSRVNLVAQSHALPVAAGWVADLSLKGNTWLRKK